MKAIRKKFRGYSNFMSASEAARYELNQTMGHFVLLITTNSDIITMVNHRPISISFIFDIFPSRIKLKSSKDRSVPLSLLTFVGLFSQ